MGIQKLIVILSVAALGILAALFWYLLPPGPREQNIGAISRAYGTVAITLGEDGFLPQEVAITRGTTVIFKTSRGKPFWPASDLHPSHTIFPEFDPKEPVFPNETWGFRFTKKGSWKYHDHLAPYFTGTIRVEEGSAEQEELPCTKEECWQKELETVLKKDGINAAFAALSRLYDQEAQFVHACHNIAHELGHASYAIFKKDRRLDFTPATAACSYGFYHGFLESFMIEQGPQKARTLCLDLDNLLGSVAPDAKLQCFHGIGHGAVIEAAPHSQEDEERMTKLALLRCEEATVAPLEISRCASGIFNTIAQIYIKNEYRLSANPRDPLRLCRIQKEPYRGTCYLSMNILLMQVARDDFAKAAQFIEAIPKDEDAAQAMINLAAIEGVNNINAKDHTDKINLCRGLQTRLRAPCLQGFAFGFLEHGKPEEEYRKPLDFCALPVLNADEKKSCFQYIASYLAQWYAPQKAQQICNGIALEYRTLCRTELDRALEWRHSQ